MTTNKFLQECLLYHAVNAINIYTEMILESVHSTCLTKVPIQTMTIQKMLVHCATLLNQDKTRPAFPLMVCAV